MGEFYLIKIHVIVVLCHAPAYVMHVIFISVYFWPSDMKAKISCTYACVRVLPITIFCANKHTYVHSSASSIFMTMLHCKLSIDVGSRSLEKPHLLPTKWYILGNFGTRNLSESYVSIALSMPISPY